MDSVHLTLQHAMSCLTRASSLLNDAYSANPAEDHAFPSSTRRMPSVDRHAIPQSIYLGLYACICIDDGRVAFSMSSHDPCMPLDIHSATINCKVFHAPCHKACTLSTGFHACLENVVDLLLRTVADYTSCNHYKAQCIGVAVECCHEGDAHGDELTHRFVDMLTTRLWLDLDIVPMYLHMPKRDGMDGHDHDDMSYVELEMCADSLARKVIVMMNPQFPGATVQLHVQDVDNQVDVDYNRSMRLVDVAAYRDYHRAAPPVQQVNGLRMDAYTWQQCMDLVRRAQQQQLRIAFFSSTPQGGGVALMRHALVRLARMLGVDMRWHVARPHPQVFDITKRKFHNVLHGVSDASLTERDEQLWQQWVTMNAKRFWFNDDVVGRADMVVMDDPQLCSMIPMMRAKYPGKRIVFRLHIQLDASIIEGKPSPATAVWDYLYNNFIQPADVFVMHPIPESIPCSVPRDRLRFFPATTDPFDGLNKPLYPDQLRYWKNVFRRLCVDQGSRAQFNVDGRYIVQVARFDPSKGYPDVIEAFCKFRALMDSERRKDDDDEDEGELQLVLCGHGSVDDPDGTVVFEALLAMLESKRYADIASSVCIARVPACDQILDALLSSAWVALQLSYREGFEVKITEASMKGVPVVVYDAGGIPCQIAHERTGFIEPVGNVDGVVARLMQLRDPAVYDAMSLAAKNHHVLQSFTTMQNLCRWLSLALDDDHHHEHEHDQHD